MGSSLFSKLWPVDVSFFSGEQPTATKLNGIIKQISSALFMLESFLGNGTDNNVTEDKNRKMIHNLSNVIGNTENLYKPVNKITNLFYIDKFFGNSTTGKLCSYDSVNDLLDVTSSTTPIVVPVNSFSGDEFGIYYTGRGVVKNLDGNGGTTTLPDHGAVYSWYKFTTTSDINYIQLMAYAGSSFKVKSLYITSEILDEVLGVNVAYNKAYSLPIANANYYTLKTPCKYSNPANPDATACASKTCDYCIGNTYEYNSADADYGSPVCLNAVSKTATPLSYSSETVSTSAQRAGYLTAQCPLVTVSNVYGIKYAPIAMNTETVDVEIPQNKCIVYDTKNSASTIKYTTSLFSGGRSDIFYIKDIDIFQEGISDSKRYIILGDYGLADLMHDLMPYTGLALPIDSFPVDVAVYADDSGN